MMPGTANPPPLPEDRAPHPPNGVLGSPGKRGGPTADSGSPPLASNASPIDGVRAEPPPGEPGGGSGEPPISGLMGLTARGLIGCGFWTGLNGLCGTGDHPTATYITTVLMKLQKLCPSGSMFMSGLLPQ